MLAVALGIPLLNANHIEAHVYACRLAAGRDIFPCVGLVVSGGHTSLFHCKTALEFELLGATLDDAAGEAFDKVAHILGLGFPGGPAIDREASQGNPKAFRFPRSFLRDERLDFSFSGLKTAVLYTVRGQDVTRPAEPPTGQHRADLAASFQQAVVDVLVEKSRQALRRTGLSRLAVGGGVAANRGLRQQLQQMVEHEGAELFIPPLTLCTDNAAMAAIAVEKWRRGWMAPLDLDAVPTYRAADSIVFDLRMGPDLPWMHGADHENPRKRCRCNRWLGISSGRFQREHGRRPSSGGWRRLSAPGQGRRASHMKKLLTMSVLSLAALSLSVSQASALWPFHHCCCEPVVKTYCRQYNAFSPYCCDTASIGCHPWCSKCRQPVGHGCANNDCCPGGDGLQGGYPIGGHNGDGVIINQTAPATTPATPNAPAPKATDKTSGAAQEPTVVPSSFVQQMGYLPYAGTGYAPQYGYGYYPQQPQQQPSYPQYGSAFGYWPQNQNRTGR